MKKWLFLFLILAFLPFVAVSIKARGLAEGKLKEGDIIFQSLPSSQSPAIQIATKSKYSHVGIIFKENGEFFVFEAVGPVKRTSLEAWVKQGEDGEYVIKRLKNADKVLTPGVLAKMKKVGYAFNGRAYDWAFEWSDDKIYCSELVWKIYQRGAGIELGQPRKLGSFDLSDKRVQAKLKERYGNKIPLDEIVVPPATLFTSGLLVTVKK